MDKLKMRSPNLVESNIVRLAELFPGCVTESADENGELKQAIDFDLLRQELSGSIVEGPQERYRLDWPGKREALLAANAPIAKTLRPCREESVDFDTTENLFIEGDNLDALKLLQETYLGKVKMIYIDPPYNTGKDFIYSDHFVAEIKKYKVASGVYDEEGNKLLDVESYKQNLISNGRFHSDWLSMMYSRLKLARNLLRDDGVIFISIDDGEQANVKKMCDEIFGEDNFIANLIWKKRDGAPNDRKMGYVHENIIAYGKARLLNSSRTMAEECFNLMPRTDKANSQYKVFKEPDDSDAKGPFRKIDTTANAKGGRDVKSLHYPVTNPYTKKKVFPREGTCWRHSQDEMIRLQKQGRLFWGVKGTARTPMRKLYLAEAKKGMTTPSILPNMPFNQHAAREIETIFGKKSLFETPKPTKLLKLLIRIGSNDNDVILDFFAGSCSVAQAIFDLNKERNSNRKFIMVQLPESCDEKSEAYKAGYSTIAEIGKERIRRAGKKISEEYAEKRRIAEEKNSLLSLADPENNLRKYAENLDTGFRVLKIDTSNMADVYYAPDAIEQGQLALFTENIKPGRSAEDLLFQVLLDLGVDLSLPINREEIDGKEVFFVDDNALAACFNKDRGITEEFVKELAKRKPMRVVFRDAGFKDDSVKINVEQIFKLMSPHTEVRTI